MKNIKIYGTGCCNCTKTANSFEQAAKEMNIDIHVEKVTDLEQIMLAGVVSTPAVSINGELKHTGSVPSIELVTQLLEN